MLCASITTAAILPWFWARATNLNDGLERLGTEFANLPPRLPENGFDFRDGSHGRSFDGRLHAHALFVWLWEHHGLEKSIQT